MRGRDMALAGALSCLFLAGGVAADPSTALRTAVYAPSGSDPAPMLQDVRVIRVHVYTCTARSRFAYGVWTAGNLATARASALYQCAIRTPRGFVCRITRCR